MFGEGEKVTEVVGVGVSQKNRVEAVQFFQGLRAARISHDPGVDERDLAESSGDGKSAVAEIGDAVAFQVEHGVPFKKKSYQKRLKGIAAANNSHS